jgi:hypothetical protein
MKDNANNKRGQSSNCGSCYEAKSSPRKRLINKLDHTLTSLKFLFRRRGSFAIAACRLKLPSHGHLIYLEMLPSNVVAVVVVVAPNAFPT